MGVIEGQTGTDTQANVVRKFTAADLRAETVQNGKDIFHILSVDNPGKLLASKTGDNIGFPRSVLKQLPHVGQNFVTGSVPIGIINNLEIIDIKHGQKKGNFLPFTVITLFSQKLHENMPVIQTCQTVKEGESLRFLVKTCIENVNSQYVSNKRGRILDDFLCLHIIDIPHIEHAFDSFRAMQYVGRFIFAPQDKRYDDTRIAKALPVQKIVGLIFYFRDYNCFFPSEGDHHWRMIIRSQCFCISLVQVVTPYHVKRVVLLVIKE